MWKDKLQVLLDYIVKHSKIVFPVAVIAAVAITVAVALTAGNEELNQAKPEESSQTEQIAENGTQETVTADIPLEKNEDGDLYTLVATYYNALATGDVETIKSINNYVEDIEAIRIQEISKYVDTYPVIEIYTKPGPTEGSYVAYVYTKVVFTGYVEQLPALQTFYICTDEEGKLYMNEGEDSEEIVKYIQTVSLQDDVVDFYNRVSVEYSDMLMANQKLLEYMEEVKNAVSKATGEVLAQQLAGEGTEEGGEQPSQEQPQGEQTDAPQSTEENPEGAAQPPVSGPVQGTATTTVNVRSSDSEQADKLGKVSEGSSVEILEQRPNGWSKIVYEDGEGYIKSEYLLVQGSQPQGSESQNGEPQPQDTTQQPADTEAPESSDNGGAAVRTAVASANLNLRKEANADSEKLKTVVGGDSVEVLSEANGWSQVRYKDTVGYVKTENLY